MYIAVSIPTSTVHSDLHRRDCRTPTWAGDSDEEEASTRRRWAPGRRRLEPLLCAVERELHEDLWPLTFRHACFCVRVCVPVSDGRSVSSSDSLSGVWASWWSSGCKTWPKIPAVGRSRSQTATSPWHPGRTGTQRNPTQVWNCNQISGTLLSFSVRLEASAVRVSSWWVYFSIRRACESSRLQGPSAPTISTLSGNRADDLGAQSQASWEFTIFCLQTSLHQLLLFTQNREQLDHKSNHVSSLHLNRKSVPGRELLGWLWFV